MSTTPKIAIIGAGPASLTLARLLQINGLRSTIYEAEDSASSRDQGGSLDLHPHMGQAALRAANLWEEFQKNARPEGEAMRVLKFDGIVLWDDNDIPREGEGRERPEIDRIVLREMLLGSLKEGTVKWGMKVVGVKEGKEGWEVVFKDGTVEKGIDLLVGGDGAWSKVRPAVTDTKPFYSGVTGIELWATEVEETNPWLARFVGKGSCFMFDEGRALLSQRGGDGSVRILAGVRVEEGWVEKEKIMGMGVEEVRTLLEERYFADCEEELRRAIKETRDRLVVRKLWMLPTGLRWEARAGVTLMGDAAHLMTPFAGVGVNVAMADAMRLAHFLVGRKESLRKEEILEAIKEYEVEMFERAKGNAEKTERGLKGHFSAGGGEKFAAMLREHFEKKE